METGRNTARPKSRKLREMMDPRKGTELAEAIRSCARLSAADKPHFAVNLGKLAARVHPDDPLIGAREIAINSGIDGVWAKRKRYFRLPGEGAPKSINDGDYASSGATFLKLAETAADLIAPPSNPELIEAEMSRAVRMLATGTSFLPIWRPSEPGERTAQGLLDEFAARLRERIKKETRLVELWKVLADSPITVAPVREDDEADASQQAFGVAAEFPSGLLYPIFRKGIQHANFEPGGDNTAWALPAIEFGRVTYELSVPILEIPEKYLKQLRGRNDEAVPPKIVEWLSSSGMGRYTPSSDDGPEEWRDMNRAFEETYGWHHVTVWLTLNAALTLRQGDGFNPEVEINLYGADTFGEPIYAFGDCGDRCGYVASNHEQIISSEGKLGQRQLLLLDYDQIGGLFPCDYLEVVYEEPCQLYEGKYPKAAGVLQMDWNFSENVLHKIDGFSGWTQSKEAMSLLLGDPEASFTPTFPKCDPLPGPFRAKSVGAALMHNVLRASGEESLTHRLITRANLTAEAGLRFHETMVDAYRDAIRQM